MPSWKKKNFPLFSYDFNSNKTKSWIFGEWSICIKKTNEFSIENLFHILGNIDLGVGSWGKAVGSFEYKYPDYQ